MPGNISLLRSLAEQWLGTVVEVYLHPLLQQSASGGEEVVDDAVPHYVNCRLVATGSVSAIRIFGAEALTETDYVMLVAIGEEVAAGQQVFANNAWYTVMEVRGDTTGAALKYCRLRSTKPLRLRRASP